ncbi:MAG TPA: phosphatase PAP2 family protein [Ktedonobacteraceae bacterium]|nr:phosphatase PAP2 family protein [Ktedonobacteraceae bacterium]
MSALWQFNYMIFQDINTPAGHNPLLDGLMIFCANYLIYFWLVPMLVLWGIPLAWSKRPVLPVEVQVMQERRSAVVWIALSCILAYGFNLFIEQFVFEPRPFITHHVNQLISHPADASFPSDHAAWSFAVVGVLLFALLPALRAVRNTQTVRGLAGHLARVRIPMWLIVIAIVIACSIGYARVYVGVHYPDDILGGAINGLLAAGIVTLLGRWLRVPTNAVLRFAHTLKLA